MADARSLLTDLFAQAGVTVDGDAPFDPRIHDERFFGRVLAWRNLGLGESYMEGWWDCERLDEFICRLLRARLNRKIRGSWRLWLMILPAALLNLQRPPRSRQATALHYDLGNAFFAGFLDPFMQYSCAYFRNGDDLSLAQRRKLRLICDKLDLKDGERLLDVGCGFGGLARFAAERYGCEVEGVTISRQQAAFARSFCRDLPVVIRERDYRQTEGSFDKIVSVGMFEHVGPKNHGTFLRRMRELLTDDGLFLLHAIGVNESAAWCDPWISRYIFPNGCLPSLSQIFRAAEGLFVLEDLHNLGPHYDRTLMAWLENFRNAWPRGAPRTDETFRRMWEYYLQTCAGAFRARDLQVWQMVFTPTGATQPRCRLS